MIRLIILEGLLMSMGILFCVLCIQDKEVRINALEEKLRIHAEIITAMAQGD
jgi:hypothetical protein